MKNLLKNAVPVGDERIVEKKIMPEFFDEVIKGNKKIEIRKDEDSIKTGDVLQLKEWNGSDYTGRQVTKKVTYVLRNVQEFGLMEGYCIIGWSE